MGSHVSVPVRLTAASAVAVLALAACTGDDTEVSPTGSAEAEPSPAKSSPSNTGPLTVSDVYDQELQWTECGDLECATLQVPLDWFDPESELIEIALNRHPARDPDARIGSLLVNPGGPGMSGLNMIEIFVPMAGESLLDSYDIVGFDPRGVGESTPVQCGTDEEIDEYYLRDIHIESQADLDAAAQVTADFAARCRELSGPIIEHVDTGSVARDMDVIRAAVGDERLNYLGYSYGSELGTSYAEQHPQNVGRLVLDGAFDVAATGPEQTLTQPQGYESALTDFLNWCSPRDSCPLDGDVDEQKRQIAAMMDRAQEQPYPTGQDWGLNGNLFFWGLQLTLLEVSLWPELERALDEIAVEERASHLYELANRYFLRDGATGEYATNWMWAHTSIRCINRSTGTDTFENFERSRDLLSEASPTFGWWYGRAPACAGWPWNSRHLGGNLTNAATAGERILLIGTTGDPATPYSSTESLAERLNGTLLTYEGEGHSAYGRSNQCIIDEVDGFLVDGEMPDSGTRC